MSGDIRFGLIYLQKRVRNHIETNLCSRYMTTATNSAQIFLVFVDPINSLYVCVKREKGISMLFYICPEVIHYTK